MASRSQLHWRSVVAGVCVPPACVPLPTRARNRGVRLECRARPGPVRLVAYPPTAPHLPAQRCLAAGAPLQARKPWSCRSWRQCRNGSRRPSWSGTFWDRDDVRRRWCPLSARGVDGAGPSARGGLANLPRVARPLGRSAHLQRMTSGQGTGRTAGRCTRRELR